jgi:predicted RNase H-like nuclease
MHSNDVYIGFDSAWTDNQKAPGAICAVSVDDGQLLRLHAPRLVSFAEELAFIREIRSADGVTLVAPDQPTVWKSSQPSPSRHWERQSPNLARRTKTS